MDVLTGTTAWRLTCRWKKVRRIGRGWLQTEEGGM